MKKRTIGQRGVTPVWVNTRTRIREILMLWIGEQIPNPTKRGIFLITTESQYDYQK